MKSTNKNSTAQGKSRGTFLVVVVVIAALAILGLLLSQMDGRIAIVTSNASTPTNTEVSSTATIAPVTFTETTVAPVALSPQAEQARAFAEPILQAIANRPPDFEDDFSTPNSRWYWIMSNDEGQNVLRGNVSAEHIKNGALFLPSENGLDTGVAIRDCDNFTNFAMQAEFTLMDIPKDGDGRIAINWRVQDNEEHYRFTIWLTLTPSWEVSHFGPGIHIPLAGGTAELNALGTSNQVSIVAYGSQFAIHLNGLPLAYVEDHQLANGEISVCNFSFGPGSMTIAIDNVKAWNLDYVSELQAAQARAFAEPILQAIANRPPDYEYDFNEPENGWISGVEESNTRGYVDGEYFVTVKPNGGTGAGPGKDFVFSDFVAEVDARIVSATDPGGWGFIFREQPFPQSFRYHINVDNIGMSLFLNTGTYTDLFYLQGAPLQPAPEMNHLLVIVKGPNIAIYINGEPVTLVKDSTFSNGIVSLGIHAGAQETEVRFDNFKIWDLNNGMCQGVLDTRLTSLV